MSENIHHEREIEKSFDAHIMKRLFKYAKPQFVLLLISVVLMLLVTALDLAIPYFTKVAIDDYISPVQQLVYKDEMIVDVDQNATNFVIPSITDRWSRKYDTPTLKLSTLYTLDDDVYLIIGMKPAKSLEHFTIEPNNKTAILNGQTYEARKLDQIAVRSVQTHNKKQVMMLTLTLGFLLVVSFFFTFGHTYLLNFASQKIV